MMYTQQHKLFGILLILVSSIAFSSKAIMVKLAYQYHVDPATLIVLRMAFAVPLFVALAIWLRMHRAPVKLSRHDVWMLLFLGVVAGYGSMWLNFAGLVYVSAGLERIILFLYPTLVVLFNTLLHQHKITRHEVIALLLSYAGVLLVVGHDIAMPSASTGYALLGTGLVFGSAVAYALYLVLSAKVIPRLGAPLFTAYTMMIISVASATHFLLTEDITVAFEQPMPVYGYSALMAVIATVLPSVMLNMGIHRVGSNTASLVSSIGPVSTIFLAWLILHEPVTLLQMAGTALVLLGVVTISLAKH